MPTDCEPWPGKRKAVFMSKSMINEEEVLPDGPPARRAATSWRVYLFWVDRVWVASRWSESNAEQREGRCILSRPDRYKSHEVTAPRAVGRPQDLSFQFLE